MENRKKIEMMQELSDEELNMISGAGENPFEGIPRVKGKALDDKVREQSLTAIRK